MATYYSSVFVLQKEHVDTQLQILVKKVLSERKGGVNNLYTAKDRAQLAATASLSMVHVVLLKELVVHYDSNDVDIGRYRAFMALVSLALVIQIFVGFIGLYLSSVRKSFEKRKDVAEKSYYNGVLNPWFCSCAVEKVTQNRDKGRSHIVEFNER